MNIQEITKSTQNEEFPNITICATSIAVAQMVTLLEEGDTQLIFNQGGDKSNLVIKRISLSPFNIKKLLAVVDLLIFSTSDTTRTRITNVEDYMRLV